MRLFVVYLKRALLTLTFVGAAVLVAGAIYIRTASFGQFLKNQADSVLADSFRGRVTLGRLDTSASGALTIYELSIRYENATIVQIPRVRLKYRLIPLLWREVRIEISAFDPTIRLRRCSDGEWDLIKALASKTPAAESSGTMALTFYLKRLDIQGGTVDLAPHGDGGTHYRFEDTYLSSYLTVNTAGLDADIAELRTRVVAPAIPPTDLYAKLSYRVTDRPAQMTVDTLRLKTQASAVSISGVIHNLQTLDSNVKVSIDRLAAADLAAIIHNDPMREDVSGCITMNGTPGTMRVQAALAAGSARLKANVIGNLTQKAPAFDGRLTLTHFEMNTLTLPQRMAGLIDVSIDARGEGSNVQTMVADSTIAARDLQVSTARLGNLDLTASAQKGEVHLSGKLANGPGHLNLDGNAVAENSRYQIVVKTEHFDTARVFRSAPPSDLNSQMVIKGSGRELNTMNARIDFQSIRSRVDGVPFESTVRGRIKAGVVDVSQAKVLSQGTAVSFFGSAGIARGAGARLSYQARVDRLGPWLKVAGMAGDGRASLDGTAVGTLRGAKGASLRAQGKLIFQSIHLSALSLASGSADYDIDGLARSGWPWGDVTAQFTALEVSGMKLRTLAADMRLGRGPSPRLRMAMEARDEKNHTNSVAATVVFAPNRVTGSLDQTLLKLSDGTWRLAQPAQFVKDRQRIAIHGFALENGARRLTLDASIAPAGAQNVTLRAHAIDLAVLKPLMPQGQQITGQLSTEIAVSGTSSAPTIDASLETSSLVINSHKAGDLDARAAYRPSSATLDVTLHQDRNHQLKLNGDIPISLSWAHGFAATIGTNEHLRLQTAGIRLAPIGDAAPRTFRNVTGTLRADLSLAGSPFRPAITGTADINGGGEVLPTGISISDFEMRLLASPTNIAIPQLSAKAGDGSLRGSGSIELHNNYSPGAINAELQLNQWPAIATEQYNSTVHGYIRARGTPDAPRVQGEIDVVDSTIHPDLDFLSASSVPSPDNTIVIVKPGENIPSTGDATLSARGGVPSSGNTNNPAFNNLAIDLKINVSRNNWIRHQNAQVELDGAVDIKKRPGGPISLVGEIDTVRGWLGFMGKRFTLASGQILFTGGPEIDPMLRIDGRREVSNYTVDVIVGGKASKPEIKLQSQPQLAQGDILSLILFGTTTSQLGRGQKSTLQQQAQSIATGAAGQALAQSLGLESLGVNVTGQSVGVGHYIGENTYVSVSPNFGANTSSTPSQVASIQYYLQRWLSITTATMSDGSRQIFLNVSKRY
jgi:autotransporter translocation and assembly factor TamB